jgi:hypothetical protein
MPQIGKGIMDFNVQAIGIIDLLEDKLTSLYC